MKELKTIIQEKLRIGKSIKIQSLKLEPIDPSVERDISIALQERSPGGVYKHDEKMKAYMNKGSKPERLIKSIKDHKKLINRWMAAIRLKWDDAIIAFGDAVSEQLNFKLEDLHKYIVRNYNATIKYGIHSGLHEVYEHYLDLYNIEH